MGELVEARRYSKNQIDLMRNTVAKGTSPDEFGQFLETAARYNLDPFKRQIHAVIFNANDAQKRQMAIVVGITGYRTMGYRAAREMGFQVLPDAEPAKFEIDESLKSDINPKGLVSATVCLRVRHNVGEEYQPVPATVYWDERAPIGFSKGGEQYLKRGPWTQQPKHMLAKCAEADAWRKIAPDDVGGLYITEEMDKPMIDITSEVERMDEDERFDKIGGRGAIFAQWAPNLPLERVPAGEFADRCLAHISSELDPIALQGWHDTNRHAMQEFWATHKSDALELKKAYEERLAYLRERAQAEAQAPA
jgi:phage recombination protein Bet